MVILIPHPQLDKLAQLVSSTGTSGDDAQDLMRALQHVADERLAEAVAACETHPELISTLQRNFKSKRHALETSNATMWSDILEAEKQLIEGKIQVRQ